MQAFFVLLGLVGACTSRVYDYRYPERIAFAGELAKLVKGPHLAAERGKITVDEPVEFKPGVANSIDLRGSMAAVIAALCANGRSVIQDMHMAMRGYNYIEGKLNRLGSRISIHDVIKPEASSA